MLAAARLLAAAAYGIGQRWQQAREARAVGAHADAIFRSSSSFVAGNPKGDVSEGAGDLYAELSQSVAEIRMNGCRLAC